MNEWLHQSCPQSFPLQIWGKGPAGEEDGSAKALSSQEELDFWVFARKRKTGREKGRKGEGGGEGIEERRERKKEGERKEKMKAHVTEHSIKGIPLQEND